MNRFPKFPIYLDRALQAALFLLALSAPISIAATQTAWALALLFWILRAFLVRPVWRKAAIDLAIITFVGLTIVSSFFSYSPEVSLRKLVAVSLVTIVYLVSENIGTAKTLRRIAAILLIAGVFTSLFVLGTFIVGKNLKVVRLAADSPLRAAGVRENDTILKANGISVNSPDELVAALKPTDNSVAVIKVYRYEILFDFEMPVSTVSVPADGIAKLGIESWSRGRDVRAAGFFGHYTTYAEAIQLVLSLAFGLLIVAPGRLFSRYRILFGLSAASMCFALFLTVTRASWVGFLISAAVMILIGTTRKTALIFLALAIPVAISGIFYLQQKRNVAFIDTKDGSTTWRMTVWREGFDLLTSDPRHLAVGIGMDSIKSHWKEWHLFDDGRLPIGHMHSTPLQLALERGLPAFIAWIIWMSLYLRMLWRGFRRGEMEWFERGVLLGTFGGTIGFLASGLVHYNWGDSEVVMIFYLLMGMSFAVINEISKPLAEPKLSRSGIVNN